MVPSAVIYLTSGILAILLVVFLFAIVYRWKYKKSLALPNYSSIVLTSHDSPQLKQKRLWSPPAKSSEETKSTSKMGRKDKQRSYWFPKRDIKPFLPAVQGEYLQPSLPKQVNGNRAIIILVNNIENISGCAVHGHVFQVEAGTS